MILSGNMVLSYNGVNLTARKGDIILQQKGDQYQLQAVDGPAEFIVISYLCEPEALVSQLTKDGKVFHSAHAARYRDGFERAEEIYRQPGVCTKTLLRAIAQQLICGILREKAENTPENLSDPASTAKRYIDEHSCRQITIEDVAGAVGCSASYLRQVFKQAHGITPNKYLNYVRIQRAKEMLASGFFTQEEISAACGFRNVYYFGRVFKEITGISPGRY